MKKIPMSILFAGTLFHAGCVSTVDTVENAEKTYVPNEVIRAHVETDASTPIKVTNLRDATAANGFLQISVEFTNLSQSVSVTHYQCEWYDENGITLPTSLTQWNKIQLDGRDARWVNFTAPNARAKDYKIRVIENR